MTVKDRQCLLTFLKKADGTSYYTGEVDGIYGRLSRKAIQDFQKDFCGLTVTGEADAVTDQAMIHAVAFGIPERDPEAEPDVTDNNVGDKVEADTLYQHWWEEIEFFAEEEFMCKCGGRYCNGWPAQMREEVVRICDAARRHFGRPGHVISGLRCEIHNANEGGVENSQHMYGEACDLMIEGVSADHLLAWIQTQPGIRYAYKINGTNVHFDIPKGTR